MDEQAITLLEEIFTELRRLNDKLSILVNDRDGLPASLEKMEGYLHKLWMAT